MNTKLPPASAALTAGIPTQPMSTRKGAQIVRTLAEAEKGTHETGTPAADGQADSLPYWWPADRVHPAWCAYPGGHSAADWAADRVCFSDDRTVDLALHDPLGSEEGPYPDYLTVHIEQRVTAAAPVIWLGPNVERTGRYLTVAEARALAAGLLAAAEQAEGRCAQ